ncbi:MAG: hypothetical protein K6F76_06480 [Clostridiales bacterium]|nr:hypothetical protein [Clostridiales bacterium]
MNLNIFSKKYSLRTSDYDVNKNLRISSILDLFQDAAGIHSDLLNAGYDDLIKQNLMWVLLRTKLTVHSMPQMHTDVTVKTWPHKPSSFGYIRDYQILDGNGNVITEGSSLWAIIDCALRKPVITEKGIYNIDSYHEESAFDVKISKRVRNFDTEGLSPFLVYPSASDIDINGHVNNTKYANYALNSLNTLGEPDICEFQIDFHHEIMLNDKVSIYHSVNDDKYCFKGAAEDGNIYFLAECKLK